MSARDPGLAGVALTRPDVVVMAIIDDVHLAGETVALILAAARGRVCLVTDAIEAAGVGDGEYRLGDRTVLVSGREARLADGTLAGSVLSMDAAVRNLIAHGVSVEEAVDAATRVPARLVGSEQLGRLRVGGRGDVTVLDDEFLVRRTLVDGVDVYAG
jgi:N-acetylglucosamine-6-phosphate deacetylase